jgi:hypothetical protein
MPRAKKTNKKSAAPASQAIPPGATRKVADEPLNPERGEPESGAGPRHAAADPGSANEEYGAAESNQPLAEESILEELEPEEEGPPYAGHSGGAVGGTPAQRRSSGGRIGHGIKPGGVHRGDSTIGTDPDSGAE